MTIDEAREDRARQLAAVQGLSLVRSRSRNRANDDYELYVLVRDAAEADSAFENGYGMTLSCFAVLRGAARPRRSWRRAGDGEVRDLGV